MTYLDLAARRSMSRIEERAKFCDTGGVQVDLLDQEVVCGNTY
jgi:hypothetical protein